MAPQQKGKGKARRRKTTEPAKRELLLKEEGQEYAQVTRLLGNARVEAQCFDGKRRLCHIRGKLRKRCWIRVSDLILISLRDYQDQKADILHKYNPDEARSLKKRGEIADTVSISATEVPQQDDIEFAEDDNELQQDFRGHLPPSDDDMMPSSEEEEIEDLEDAIDDL
ncbi:hypothetical protein P9112_010746 [Eukaryota sp. TZLM1-RC]